MRTNELVASSPRFLLFALFAVVGVAGCHPKYPACNNDDDCNRDQNRHEFCVNQLCQQCRGDKDCQTGESCNKGRCEAIPGYCDDSHPCSDRQACVNNRCQACTSDAQCNGGKCSNGRCYVGDACDSNAQCPEDSDCKAGHCVKIDQGASSQSAACNLAAVYFDFNESSLTSEATSSIDNDATCIKQVSKPVTLIGRADPRGTEEYNLALSERRARSVKGRLVRLGLSKKELKIVPKGALGATGTDEAGWAQDRRVDFQWR